MSGHVLTSKKKDREYIGQKFRDFYARKRTCNRGQKCKLIKLSYGKSETQKSMLIMPLGLKQNQKQQQGLKFNVCFCISLVVNVRTLLFVCFFRFFCFGFSRKLPSFSFIYLVVNVRTLLLVFWDLGFPIAYLQAPKPRVEQRLNFEGQIGLEFRIHQGSRFLEEDLYQTRKRRVSKT